MRRYAFMWFIVAMVVTGLADAAMTQRPPEGQLSLGVSFTITPSYLDPAEATQVIASAFFLYALHDALLKPLPGNPMAPALATSWTESFSSCAAAISLSSTSVTLTIQVTS